MTAVAGVGERVDELLAALRSGSGDPAAVADELVRLLVGLYGDGLERIVAVLGEHGAEGTAILTALTEDPLVESLLLLHDLHPLDVDARVQQALDEVRPYLGSHAGGVEYLGVTDGVARLRLEGSCNGCPSSTVTVQLAIEGAVLNAAPEVSEVVVEGMTKAPEPALLQIGRRPEPAAAGAGVGAGDGWITLPDVGPPSSPSGDRVGRGDDRAGLRRPGHALCLPGCVRGLRFVPGRRAARTRAAHLPGPGLRHQVQRAASRPGHRRRDPAP